MEIGDIVAIERTDCVDIAPGNRYMFCANCFRQNDLDLIPCPNYHSAMFCSPECLTAENQSYHVIECPIMDALIYSCSFDYESYVAFRLFILPIKNFKTADKLMKFVHDLDNHEQNVFNVNYNQSMNKDLFSSVLKLMVGVEDSKHSSICGNA